MKWSNDTVERSEIVYGSIIRLSTGSAAFYLGDGEVFYLTGPNRWELGVTNDHYVEILIVNESGSIDDQSLLKMLDDLIGDL